MPKLSAYDYAVGILSRGDYSRAALTEKLARKYPAVEAKAAVNRLVEQGYLDEKRMVTIAWESLYAAENCAVRIIKQKLLEKGFPAEIIAECAEGLDEDSIREHDLNAARKLATRKFGTSTSCPLSRSCPPFKGGGREAAGGCSNDASDIDGGDYTAKRREWEKVAAFLYRHGFGNGVCRTIANELIKN